MGQQDQQLVFDLSDPSDAIFFLACVRGLKELTLIEYLWPGRAVRAGHRPLAGQYVAFLYHEKTVYKSAASQPVLVEKKIKRRFPPGSNWLYLKLYCTPLTADRILAEVLQPVLQRHRNIVNSWFFIRYTDPGEHLRLRFDVAGPDGGRLLAGLCKCLEESGLDQLVHMQSDTYQRELERYGARLIALAEIVFWRSSELLLARLVKRPERIDEFSLGFAAARFMVSCFFNKEEALDFTHRQSEAFLVEFKADKAMSVSLDVQFRLLRSGLDAPVVQTHGDPEFDNLGMALAEIKQAAAAEPAGRRQQLLGDLVHMQLNRTFRTEQRKQELLVWYCLAKYLRSLKARSQKA
jgi:thiopeptide-type bacteriocin biosynthesis protein